MNSWNYEFVQRNGLNVLEGSGPGSVHFLTSSLGFNDEGRFSIKRAGVDGSKVTLDGNWSFQDSDESLTLNFDDPEEGSQTFTILRLKNDELWLEERLADDVLFEYHLDGEE